MHILDIISKSDLIRKAILGLSVVHFVLQLVMWLPHQCLRTDRNRDMIVYYTAAQHAVKGQPLYTAWPDYGPNVYPTVYLYPPQFAAALAPAGWLTFETFSRLWYVLLLLCFWGYAYSLARISSTASKLRGTLVWGLVLAVTPGVYYSMSLGQVDALLWAVFGLAMCGIGSTRSLLLSVAMQIKIYAAWTLLLCGYKEGVKTVVPGLIFLGAGIVLGALVCGPQAYVVWVRDVFPVIGQGTFNSANISISFCALRLARVLGWGYRSGPLPEAPRFYLSAVAALAPAFVAYCCRKQDEVIFYGTVTLAAVLFAPLCWFTYPGIGYVIVARAWKIYGERHISISTPDLNSNVASKATQN